MKDSNDLFFQSNNFNFIRVVAAALVIITHTYVLVGLGIGHDFLYQLTHGDMAVSVFGLRAFFIISGFLIAQSMERSSTYNSFLIKRILRIFPGLMVCLLITILIFGAAFTNTTWLDYFSRWSTWQHLQNIFLFKIQFMIPTVFENNPAHTVNGSIWTLAYEFSYYIMVMCLHRLGMFNKKWMALVVFASFFLIRIYTLYGHVPAKIFYFVIYTDLQLDYFSDFGLFFMAGVILYLYRNRIAYTHLLAFAMLILYILSVAIDLPWIMKYITIPYVVMYLAFVPKNAIITNWGKKTDLSYGIYIYGMPVQQSVIAVLGVAIHPELINVFVLILLLPIAWLSWNGIEKTALQFKGKFVK